MGSELPTRLDYRSAGVDLVAGEAVVDAIGAAVRATHGPEVLRGLGHFGGFYRIGPTPSGATLVASTDSVGTKLKVAILAGRHEGIGRDLVHHCINDIVACGARPLFFLDYYATGKLHPEHASLVIGSIAAACREHGIALIGGETAELPGIYAGDDYDIVGFIVGLVDADHIIDGSAVSAGDLVLGLPSSGFHTNGYSLVRTALGLNTSESTARAILHSTLPGGDARTLADLLLEPHRCYGTEVSALVSAGIVHGMAHITGGGLPGNVSRVVPEGLQAALDPSTWETPAVMEYVIRHAGIDRAEAYRAFNMGIGFVVIVAPADADQVQRLVPEARVIGRIAASSDAERVRIAGVA